MSDVETPSIVVRCIKADGVRRVVFKRYPSHQRNQAEIDAAGLKKLGIAAEIVDETASPESFPK